MTFVTALRGMGQYLGLSSSLGLRLKTDWDSNCLHWNTHFTWFSSVEWIYKCVLHIIWKLKISRFWKCMTRNTEKIFQPQKSRSNNLNPPNCFKSKNFWKYCIFSAVCNHSDISWLWLFPYYSFLIFLSHFRFWKKKIFSNQILSH